MENVSKNCLQMVLNGRKICYNLMKTYSEDSNKGYIFKINICYSKDLNDLHSGFPFLTERMKINKCSKLVCSLHDKKTILFIEEL